MHVGGGSEAAGKDEGAGRLLRSLRFVARCTLLSLPIWRPLQLTTKSVHAGERRQTAAAAVRERCGQRRHTTGRQRRANRHPKRTTVSQAITAKQTAMPHAQTAHGAQREALLLAPATLSRPRCPPTRADAEEQAGQRATIEKNKQLENNSCLLVAAAAVLLCVSDTAWASVLPVVPVVPAAAAAAAAAAAVGSARAGRPWWLRGR